MGLIALALCLQVWRLRLLAGSWAGSLIPIEKPSGNTSLELHLLITLAVFNLVFDMASGVGEEGRIIGRVAVKGKKTQFTLLTLPIVFYLKFKYCLPPEHK